MITLTKREKLLLKVLVICIAGIIIYYLIILPIMGLSSNSENKSKKYRDDIQKLESIYREYKDIQQRKSQYSALLDKKNENITSLIEQWATSSGIAKNIANTGSNQSFIQNKYIRISTDIRIEGVAIQQFLKFLYEVEHSDNLIKVSSLRIIPALKGTNTYDVSLKIDNFISK
ncbi:MAG: type II secretion system protein GspM [Spirochaetota bacterium]